MYPELFSKFLRSGDVLQVYKDGKLLFSSNEVGLAPLIEYIDGFGPYHRQVIICDKIMGNAAALLCARAACQKVYSPLGSQLAARTLSKYSIKYHFGEMVPYIQKPDGQGMCPMEGRSIGKEPEEFFNIARDAVSKLNIVGSAEKGQYG
jgi:hypothetical protein